MCRPAAVFHCRLVALAHSARSLSRALVATQFRSATVVPRPKTKILLAACGTDLKNENSCLRRVQAVSSPPVDAQSLSSFVVESSLLTAQFPLCTPRPCSSLARGSACLRAPASRLYIAPWPLHPKKTRKSEVLIPDAPRTTQI